MFLKTCNQANFVNFYVRQMHLRGCVIFLVGKSKAPRGERFPSTEVLLEEPENLQPGNAQVLVIYKGKKTTT